MSRAGESRQAFFGSRICRYSQILEPVRLINCNQKLDKLRGTCTQKNTLIVLGKQHGIFWGLILSSHYDYTMQGPADIYPVAQTMKNFYVFPVTPGASMSIASVSVDIPPEDVNTLRYSVTIVNTGQVLGGYRLLATSNEIILDGSYLLPSA